MSELPKPALPIDPTLDFGPEEQAEQLVRILDQYLAELKAGQSPDRNALLAQHPQLAHQLNACLAGLDFIHGATDQNDSPTSQTDDSSHTTANQKTLGDFRILREVGRGGMGAVFEATQISLGRRVALKVLRYAGVSDPEALDRFQREAETVARLHHTNIVPVFAVGCDQGVNYYAMQFIDGQSLADVLAKRTSPLPISQVTDWGLQAAEALAHAHDRHVIHRDVKPSNLLLDAEERIWLTDFGLARRLDDVTLSMTGALLGTPRYMSPEQASASRRLIDRRTDVYSLGATLYELLTGQPAFQGDSPHQVIQQILTSQPRPVRELRPDVPRDLETVVMKCLAKEAPHRYLGARQLADDLRACNEGRPIQARRANLAERTVRWIRDHRNSVQNSSLAAIATLLLVIASITSWNLYQAARLSQLSLTSQSGSLTAEILDSNHTPITTVPVPTDRPVPLPGDHYSLRVAAPDRWDRQYQVELPPGEDRRYDLSLQDQQLWPSTEIKNWYQVVDDTRTGALVQFDADEVRFESRHPRQLLWSVPLAKRLGEKFPELVGVRWPWFPSDGQAHFTTGPSRRSPLAAAQTLDTDRDGERDLILAARHQAFVVALSGKSGDPLWFRPLGHDLSVAPVKTPYPSPPSFRSSVLFAPQLVGDRDGDQVDDLLVVWIDTPSLPAQDRNQLPLLEANSVAARRYVELLSGATGSTLWQTALPDAPFQLASNEDCPPEFQWLAGNGFGVSSGMSGGSYFINRHLIRNAVTSAIIHGPYAYRPDEPRTLPPSKPTLILLPAGDQLLTLDLARGEIQRQDPLPARPGSAGTWTDCDGDGQLDFVFRARRAPPPGFTGHHTELFAYSPALHKTLWNLPLDSHFPNRESFTVDPPSWPLAADLDGDGAAELIAPHHNSSSAVSANLDIPWGTLVVVDGKTGQIRFEKRIVSSDQQIDRFLPGPDVDHDGYRDLFVATLSDYPLTLYVDCISGKSGDTLWTTNHAFRGGIDYSNHRLVSLQWWNAGESGSPQLIVSVQTSESEPYRSETIMFSADDGRLTHRRSNVARCEPHDVDFDGVDDLVTFVADSISRPEDGGRVDCIRGVAGEPWNRIGLVSLPADDFDQDGVRDLLEAPTNHQVAARSGRDGKLLWTRRLAGAPGWLPAALTRSPHDKRALFPSATTSDPLADVDGDGVRDVFVSHNRQMGSSLGPFALLSGRTGKILWDADNFASRNSGGVQSWRIVDLEQDGRAELVVAFASDFQYDPWRLAVSSADLEWWLAVFDAPTGRVRWKSRLSNAYSETAAPFVVTGNQFPLHNHGESFDLLHAADLDGDKNSDLVSFALAESNDRLELQAFHGATGARLWSHPLPASPEIQSELFRQHPPQIVDIDRDGRPEVAILAREFTPGQGTQQCHYVWTLLDGASGKLRATWRSDRLLHQYATFQNGERSNVSDMVVLNSTSQSRRLAISIAGDPGKVLVWDGIDAPRTIKLPTAHVARRIWPVDLEEDGIDEIAILAEQRLWIFDLANLETPRWKSPDEFGTFEQIVGVRSLTDSNGRRQLEMSLLRNPGDNSIVGIDLTTHRQLWTCPGPILRGREGNLTPSKVEPLHLSQVEPPRFFFQSNQLSLCRTANIKSGGELAAKGMSRLVRASPPSHDARWGKYLPWHFDVRDFPEVFQSIFGATVISLVLVVIPVGYLAVLIRWRRWSLKSLFVAPLLVGIMIVASTIRPPVGLLSADDVAPGPALRWIIALVTAPAVIFGIRLLKWCCTWQWKRVAIWLGLIVATSFGLAAFMMIASRVWASSTPEEHFLWDGWYVIFGFGFYMLSWPALPIVTLLDWWRARQSSRRSAIHSPTA